MDRRHIMQPVRALPIALALALTPVPAVAAPGDVVRRAAGQVFTLAGPVGPAFVTDPSSPPRVFTLSITPRRIWGNPLAGRMGRIVRARTWPVVVGPGTRCTIELLQEPCAAVPAFIATTGMPPQMHLIARLRTRNEQVRAWEARRVTLVASQPPGTVRGR